MKLVKKLSTAQKMNLKDSTGQPNPILKVGKSYIVLEAADVKSSPMSLEFTVLRLEQATASFGPSWSNTGHISIRHLERLNNGNWGIASPEWPQKSPAALDALARYKA